MISGGEGRRQNGEQRIGNGQQGQISEAEYPELEVRRAIEVFDVEEIQSAEEWRACWEWTVCRGQ